MSTGYPDIERQSILKIVYIQFGSNTDIQNHLFFLLFLFLGQKLNIC